MTLVDAAARLRAAVKAKFRPAAALLAALALAACGDDGGKPTAQVAARVNASEISIHQVDLALSGIPALAPEMVAEARRRALDQLVDQELAVQEALAAKLDHNPAVMQTLSTARREILAQAYLEQVAAGVPAPTPAEIAAYYRAHPELFSGRKIYHLQELLLPAAPEIVAMARAEIARGRSAAELEAWLESHRQKAASRVVIKPAEKIDLGILPRLAAMQDGQTALFERDGRPSVITVLAVIPEPLAEDDARPLIEQYLRRQQGEARERDALRRLRAKASIEYLGEFSADADAARKRAAAAGRRMEEARAAARQARAAEIAAPPDADALAGGPAAPGANGRDVAERR